MTIKFKKCIDEIKPYKPGKPIDEVKRELGLSKIIKLASNENAFGVSALVKEKLQEVIENINIYPDGAAWSLRKKLAAYLSVEQDELVLGNGSNEIIEFLVRGFVNEGDEVLSSQYAFLVYPILTKVCNGKYVQAPADNYAYDLDAIAKAVTERTKVIFLANPNNPTGTYFTRTEFDSFLKKIPKDIIVCLDEAYVDFVEADNFPNGLDYFRQGNVVVLRTFSKAFGLAGLRIGYALASKELITYFNKIRQPFNTNSLAQCAAEAVLDDKNYYQATLKLVADGKNFFYSALEKLGLEFIKSQTNFILINVKMDSFDFFQKALNQGVVLRDMKAYKLDNFVRVTIGNESENKKVMEVISNLVK